MLLVVSETGLVYTFTTPKLQPLVTKPEGKNLIQSCLNAPDNNTSNTENNGNQAMMASPSLVSFYLRVFWLLYNFSHNFFFFFFREIYQDKNQFTHTHTHTLSLYQLSL